MSITNSPSGAAFFDLDGTLITVNTTRLWLRRERRLGRISAWQMAHAAMKLGAYRLGFLDMEATLRYALARFIGLAEDRMWEETRAWWREDVRQFAAPGAGAVLEHHRRRGERLVLLTSSSRYAAEMARGEFGLDDVLFQGFEVRDGRLTGEPTHPICYSHGKVEVAEAWARANDIDLGASSYYTDSSTDLPMLERVGRPFAVHPDPRLARIARARGWPVLDWRTGGA